MSSLPEVVADFNILSGTIKMSHWQQRKWCENGGIRRIQGLVWANKTIRATVHMQGNQTECANFFVWLDPKPWARDDEAEVEQNCIIDGSKIRRVYK